MVPWLQSRASEREPCLRPAAPTGRSITTSLTLVTTPEVLAGSARLALPAPGDRPGHACGSGLECGSEDEASEARGSRAINRRQGTSVQPALCTPSALRHQTSTVGTVSPETAEGPAWLWVDTPEGRGAPHTPPRAQRTVTVFLILQF